MRLQSLLALGALAVTAAVSQASLVAYVDLSGGTTPPGGKTVTNIAVTTSTVSGGLVDYDTGVAMGSVAVSAAASTSGGLNPAAATPLYNAFNGYVNLVGAAYAASGTLTFSGLDNVNFSYDLIIGTDRSTTTNAWVTSLTISGADAFTNSSSAGSFTDINAVSHQTFSSPSDATTLLPIKNSSTQGGGSTVDGPGYIARWSGVDPGSDGTFVVTFANNVGTNSYVNAIRLEATPVPEPASMAMLGLGALAMIRRRRS